MSKAARQRRLKKERERQQRRAKQSRSSGGPASAYGAGPGSGPELSREERAAALRQRAVTAVSDAADALCMGQLARYDSAIARLASAESPTWPKAISLCLTEALTMSVTNAWRAGWQPAELVRHIGRELSQAHASMLADMIISEMRRYAAATVDESWAAQIAGLPVTMDSWGNDTDYLSAWQAVAGARTTLGGTLGTVATAIEVLHQLQHLPVLEKLLPLPGTAASHPAPARKAGNDADDRVLSRIRALLAKAESTEFAEEAEALSGRAQELMAKYSIDHALLAAAGGDQETPVGRRVPVDNPYESPKVQLLTEVAAANRCRTVWMKEVGLVTVIGFQADLDAVELLFTSLLVQANTAMIRAGARQDARGRSRTRAFRQSFLVSYAYRIGERLSEATDHVVKEAAGEHARVHAGAAGPGTSLVPLLAAREQEVDDAVEEMFGGSLTRSRAARATDLEGWDSGRAAADMATLNNRDQLPD